MAKGFDNAYTKMTRKLAELGQQFDKELGENEGMMVEVYPDGSGALYARSNKHQGAQIGVALYTFSDYDDLMAYLEAGPLKRTIMSQKV